MVYSSNIFAIMGLRSLYTLVAKAVQDLPYLRPAVALVLAFIAAKMLLEFMHITISITTSLFVVFGLLSGGVVLSLRATGANPNTCKPHGDTGGHAIEPGASSKSRTTDQNLVHRKFENRTNGVAVSDMV